MKETTLVTGGAGFIGSHFIEMLLERDSSSRIICLDNFNSYYSPEVKRENISSFVDNPRVVIIEASFCDDAAMKELLAEYKVTHLVHLGGYAGVQASIARPLVYEEANVRGTLSLLEAARHHPVHRFVLVSSSTVYGGGAATPFREDAPLGVALSPYAASKRSAEAFGMMYFQVHKVPVVCIRPFSVYGPRVRPDLAMSVFANAIMEDIPIPLNGDGTIQRDFTYISDICDGLYSAMFAVDVAGEAINLGNHEPVSISQLIKCLEHSLDRSAIINYLPAALCDMPITFADLTKAEQMLAYRPSIAFKAGVARFATWFLARHQRLSEFSQQ